MIGTGRTLNLSSSGALVVDNHPMKVGQRIDLFADWPIKLDGIALQLVATGKVVRSHAGVFALSFNRHEFRTARKQVESVTGNDRQREVG